MNFVVARVVGLLGLVGVLGGCALPSAIGYKVFGPPAVPPRYAPPKEPLLVLVENTHAASQAVPEADELTTVVFNDLKDNQVGPLVSPDRVHELRDMNQAAFSKLSVSEIGRRLGAKQVIYITLDKLDFDAPAGGDVVRLSMAARVKVIDTTTARMVWPEVADEPFDYQGPFERVTSETSRSSLKRDALRESGTQIARWFYPYKPETMREENKDEKLR